MPLRQALAITLTLLLVTTTVVAETRLFKGFANGSEKQDIVEYSLDGIKLGTHKGVSTSDIDPEIRQVAQGRFAQIKLKDRLIWVRLDRLKLAAGGPIQECPEGLPSDSKDRVIAGTSGVSPNCRAKKQ